MNANLRAEFIRAHAESKFIIEAWNKIMAFPNVLFESIQLPPLTPTENEALIPNDAKLGRKGD
jgi:hypothetical protein